MHVDVSTATRAGHRPAEYSCRLKARSINGRKPQAAARLPPEEGTRIYYLTGFAGVRLDCSKASSPTL